jgi:hypothetical protein
MGNLNGHEAGNGGHRQGDPKSADRLFSYSAPSSAVGHADFLHGLQATAPAQANAA